MKRHKVSKLQLNRETLHHLGDALAAAAGAAVVPISANGTCSNAISICLTCTTPLDTCPPQPTTPATTCT
jgi:hypothetical protein